MRFPAAGLSMGLEPDSDGFIRDGGEGPPYARLIPLREIIAAVKGVGVNTRTVMRGVFGHHRRDRERTGCAAMGFRARPGSGRRRVTWLGAILQARTWARARYAVLRWAVRNGVSARTIVGCQRWRPDLPPGRDRGWCDCLLEWRNLSGKRRLWILLCAGCGPKTSRR